jgi:hypothetical protein
MRPTEEQERAVELFLTGESLRINAFAGAGKTSTLLLIAAATTRRGAYFAFNRSIAVEAGRKFPAHVVPYTLHGYALRCVRARFPGGSEKLFGELNPNRIAELLNLQPMRPSRDCYLTPRMVAAVVKGTVQRFCQSDSVRPAREHVPHWGSTAAIPWWRFRGYASTVAALAERLWERMIDPRESVPLGHDGYLKLWALSNPMIPAEFILLDEAQDSNGVVIGLLSRQPAQVVLVGDRYQQIYEWRGAVNAMDRMKTTHHADLTQSFRFGPAIADAASRVLRVLGERKRIRGNDVYASVLHCETPDAVLCRTNATVLTRTMEALAGGRRVAIGGGGEDLLRLLDDVDRLQEGRRSSRPAFFGYRRWSEVVKAADSEEGADLRGTVKLVEKHGVEALRCCLHALATEETRADLVLTTVHKAKGREWARVAIADDFSPFRRGGHGLETVIREDVRLVYVAITRAREAVEIPARLRRKFGIAR